MNNNNNFDEDALYQQQLQDREYMQSRQQYDQTNTAVMMEEQNKSIAKEQLDLSEDIIRIENLLRGRYQAVDKDGSLKWFDPKTTEDVLLTEAGVNLVLNTIQWYLNKDTLLSNYDEATILIKMEDFATSLADLIFMNYERYFLFPSAEECEEKLKQRLYRKLKERKYTLELRGETVNELEMWKKIVSEINPDYEREKIRDQIKKNKLKSFDLLMRVIQDVVHSTYLRALGGAERRTLRQHIHISESYSPSNQNQKSGGAFDWFKAK